MINSAVVVVINWLLNESILKIFLTSEYSNFKLLRNEYVFYLQYLQKVHQKEPILAEP